MSSSSAASVSKSKTNRKRKIKDVERDAEYEVIKKIQVALSKNRRAITLPMSYFKPLWQHYTNFADEAHKLRNDAYERVCQNFLRVLPESVVHMIVSYLIVPIRLICPACTRAVYTKGVQGIRKMHPRCFRVYREKKHHWPTSMFRDACCSKAKDHFAMDFAAMSQCLLAYNRYSFNPPYTVPPLNMCCSHKSCQMLVREHTTEHAR